MSAPLSNPKALKLRGVSRTYGSIAALKNFTAEFRSGEVHALVGENGAGKSTLGKLMLGIEIPDSGSMRWQDQPVNFRSPADATLIGLVGISQELSLMPDRSVVDNLSTGQEDCFGPFVNAKATLARAVSVMERFDMRIDPHARVGELPMAEQQKVEILRALNRDANLIVFDEPTARLESQDAKKLMDLLRLLADQGKAVVFISHFLKEVLSVSDTISILRNGELVRTRHASEETHSTLVHGMTGAEDLGQFPQLPPRPIRQPPVAQMENVTRRGQFEDISFSVQPGEIVGLAGLVGAGRSEVAMALVGAEPLSSGRIEINGLHADGLSVADTIERGVALVPESRRDQGLMLHRPIIENITLPYLQRFMGWLGLKKVDEQTQSKDAALRVHMKYGSLSDEVATLSGGNQQKILFARGAMGRPKLLIADEPTRGVDVGAKRGIYELLIQRASEGLGILLISSEIEEILGLSHRVIVLSRGRKVADLIGEEINEQAVMVAAFGGN